MSNPDINIQVGDTRFNFRVAGIITTGNKVLLHKPNICDFWNMPGGRVKSGENTLEAFNRECVEEMGVTFDNATLMHVAENFFTWQGKKSHELLFVYKVDIPSSHKLAKQQDFPSCESDEVIYKWFDKAEVINERCLPEIIYKLVERTDNEIQHTFGH